MKEVILTVRENAPLIPGVYRMVLGGDVSAVTAPGQFVNIALAGRFLRRPISVSDLETDTLTILYKVVGKGTEQMADMPAGTELNVLTGLGNGFDVTVPAEKPLLVGGGIGTAPLYLLAKRLIAAGRRPSVLLGFNTAREVFYEEEFRSLGLDVTVATVDGSRGVKGFVSDAMAGAEHDWFYACGPEPMLRAVFRASAAPGELSFEERMGCGFGACMGCTCETVAGPKRICRDGPVLRKEEILWER